MQAKRVLVGSTQVVQTKTRTGPVSGFLAVLGFLFGPLGIDAAENSQPREIYNLVTLLICQSSHPQLRPRGTILTWIRTR